MKAIILARVSTEEQKEAGHSLPAQIARLENYCRQKGFEVVRTYSFDESAYKTKRDEFDGALEYLKSSKEKIAVCFDKVDRFSRNVFDKRVASLYELAMKDEIELHFVSDNLVINSIISATEKFHFGINLGLAKYYSDAISDSVKRSYEQKLRRGEWLGKAPIGYINIKDDKGNKMIVSDPERAHLIRQVFEMYATGNYSMLMIGKEMERLGLRNNTASQKPISNSQVEWIIKNPFYYGEMEVKGKLYQHKYEPLISRHLFLKAQEIAKNWGKKPFKYASLPFIFRGLITCDVCGRRITPEIKKGRYIYYSCTNYGGAHKKRVYVSEEEILKPIYKALKSLQIPQDKFEWLTSKLKEIHSYKNEYHTKEMNRLKREYDSTEARVSKLLDMKLDGSITTDMYDKKLAEFKSRQADILLQMEEHSKADENFYITAKTVLDLSQRALEIFESSEVKEKRALLNFLLQNSSLNGRKLVFTLRKPFDSFVEANDSKDWLRR